MSSFKQRELAAQKQKEDAKRFLQAHHCGPRDPNKPISNSALEKDSRDNTFRILQQATAPPPAAKPTQQQVTDYSAQGLVPPPPKGWAVAEKDPLQFVRHQSTGCAVRKQPPMIVGKGLSSAQRDIPLGWKLIKYDDDDDAAGAKFYFWNPYTLQSTFAFPLEPALVVEEEKEEQCPVVEQQPVIEEEEEEALPNGLKVVIATGAIAPAKTINKRPKLSCFEE